MKSLKLEHHLAELVLKGQKNTTWRLYDDKDLSVGDEVNLIDKVKPTQPASWKIIGVALITKIIQKRLGEIVAEDYEGHEKFLTQQDLLKTYRQYYGPQVDMSTPLKIISFTFKPATAVKEERVVEKTAYLKELSLYADGGSRGNPGPSASGFAVFDMAGNLIVKKGIYLGLTTNNQAEYQALKLGLEEVVKMKARVVHVYMDSLLVINQMLGLFKVRNRDLWPIHKAIKDLLPEFQQVTFVHVRREFNKTADAAVNEALDEAAKG